MIQKKTKLIIDLVLLVVVSLSLIFNAKITSLIYSSLETKFNIVSSKNNLRVHFVSVGSGDAIAINLPDGKTMLIDTGTASFARHYSSYIERKVVPFDSDKSIDYLLLTHPDADHIGGTVALLENVSVDLVYMPIVESDTKTYTKSVEAIEATSHSEVVTKDKTITGTDYRIDILGPFNIDNSTNNACPVVRLEYRGKVFLFVGDIELEAEQKFEDEYGRALDADVLKVAHHGSNSSTSTEFLQSVTPEISIISVGKNNYGHPTEEVLTRLEDSGSEIYRTDSEGDIMLVLGERYDLSVVTGNATITIMPFDYWIIVIVVDSLILIRLVVVLIGKDDKPTLKQVRTKIRKAKKNKNI